MGGDANCLDLQALYMSTAPSIGAWSVKSAPSHYASRRSRIACTPSMYILSTSNVYSAILDYLLDPYQIWE